MAQRLATVRAAWNADRSKLVPYTSDDAATLAYPVGMQLADEDVQAYDELLADLDVDPDNDNHGADGAQPLLAEWRVWMDAKGTFVHERDPLAVSLKYAVNDVVASDDVDAYQSMGEAPESNPGSGVVIVKERAAPDDKMVTPSPSKRKQTKAQTRSTAGDAGDDSDPDGAGTPR